MHADTSHTTSTALRTLMDLHGVASKGTAILQAMDAPYLFLHRGGRYLAGAAFLSPPWLNNYLQPRGYRLTEHTLQHREIRTFLRSHGPAVLLLGENNALVIRRCEENHICLAPPHPASPDGCWLTFPALLRKLPQSLTAFTLEPCPPAPVDAIPLLCESVRTLAAYRRELAEHLARTVTRQDMQSLHQQLFRALLVDLPGVAHLYTDLDVVIALHELAHIYRHLFIIGENEVHLRERLPLGMINRATLWLQELILDRLYELGAPDDMLEPLHAYTRI